MLSERGCSLNNIATVKTHVIFNDDLKNQLRSKTKQLGEFQFDDDVWYCKNKHIDNRSSSVYNLVFSNLPIQCKNLIKYFVLMRSNLGIGTLKTKIRSLAYFFQFLEQYHKRINLVNVNRKIINKYEEFIMYNNKARTQYFDVHDFFSTMASFPEMPKNIPSKARNPFKLVLKNNNDQYIPAEVVIQWDSLMKNYSIEIPLELRTVYWMLRSFPNRINEVLSMNNNCLKSMYDNYVINVPTTKQNGGYLRPEIKALPVKYQGHGKYIIDLIKQLIVQQEEFLKDKLLLESFRKKYLFLKLPWGFIEKYSEYVGLVAVAKTLNTCYKKLGEWFKILENNHIHYVRKNKKGRLLDENDTRIAAYLLEKSKRKRIAFNDNLFNELKLEFELRSKADSKLISDPDKLVIYYAPQLRGQNCLLPLTDSSVNKSFKKLAEFYNIKDNQGNTYSITTHQFRHNAITDRLYLGFTMEQVMVQSNHKGETMPKQYAHFLKEKHKEILEDIHKLKNPKESSVEFKGRIMNFKDRIVERQLLSNQRAFLTWEANGKKGVGICSDIIGCNPKGTSVYHECYACDWFVPKAEYLADYKREVEHWERIIVDCVDKPNRAAHLENALRNQILTDRVVKICEYGIEKYKEEQKNKMQGKVFKNEVQSNAAKEAQ